MQASKETLEALLLLLATSKNLSSSLNMGKIQTNIWTKVRPVGLIISYKHKGKNTFAAIYSMNVVYNSSSQESTNLEDQILSR